MATTRQMSTSEICMRAVYNSARRRLARNLVGHALGSLTSARFGSTLLDGFKWQRCHLIQFPVAVACLFCRPILCAPPTWFLSVKVRFVPGLF